MTGCRRARRWALLLPALLCLLPGLLLGSTGPQEVRIVYFGPADPADPIWGDAWVAASIAIEQANRAGGQDGKPYRLIPVWSGNPWGTGIARLARAVYEEAAWAVLVPTDGSAAHLAEQVAAKARLPLVASGSTDKTVNLAHVSWVFSCPPPDDRIAAALADRMLDDNGAERFAVLSATDHDSHRAARELMKALALRQAVPLRHLQFDPGVSSREVARHALESGAGTVVILADVAGSARWVRALRSARDDLRIYGGASLGHRQFVEQAGEAADGVRFPLTCAPASPHEPFAREFRSRTGKLPDCSAAEAHQATRLLIAAIREAGLDRERIREALAGLSGWSGVAGVVEWNRFGQNLRPVRSATIREGRIEPITP